MTVYYMKVPDLEPQTLIHYNEIFKKVLKDVYGKVPKVDWIDRNKDSLDRITEALPEEYERGNTIHYNSYTGQACYGYSYEYLNSNHLCLIQVTPVCSDRVLIGVIE